MIVSLFKGLGGAYGQAALLKKQAEVRKQQAEARLTQAPRPASTSAPVTKA